MNDWEKFNGTKLSEKEDSHSHLHMEDINYADYMHVKKVCKDFEMKNVGEYHDLYVTAIHHCYQMYLRTFEICVLKYTSLTWLDFLQHQD